MQSLVMTSGLRKLSLTAHVTSSVGWLGAVASFLALSILGLRSHDGDLVRGAYIAMNAVGQFVIVPLCVASLLTGLVQALGTRWGLLRHYWVVAKLGLTVVASVLLMLHQFTAVATAARRASGTPFGSLPDIGPLGTQLVGDAALALLVLFITTTLSIYKPWGPTPFASKGAPRSLFVKIVLVTIGLLLAVFVVVHLSGRSPSHHH